MYLCTNCGTELEELYKRYCPSVLKLLKCDKCGHLADKYIEYDRAIILVDLILIEKQVYRHLLFNSDLTSYWKLIIVLWLAESFRSFSLCEPGTEKGPIDSTIFGDCNFYLVLPRTALALASFLIGVIISTEIKWMVCGEKPRGYSLKNLIRALLIGGCGKLLGLLGIVWRHISSGPHSFLIHGYTVLCLLTAYSVVCNSGKIGSLFCLAMGFLAYHYTLGLLPTVPLVSLEAT